jgi:hypothetical protein
MMNERLPKPRCAVCGGGARIYYSLPGHYAAWYCKDHLPGYSGATAPKGKETEVKTGAKTTEFWVTLGAIALLYATRAEIVPHGDEVLGIVEAVGALLLAAGYTWARTLAKIREQKGGK